MQTQANSPDPQQLRSWLQGVARRDAACFKRLYDATSGKLFGYVLRVVPNRELAEEALQEAFIAIWNNAGSYQTELAAPMTWMSKIARNKALDILRRGDHSVEIDRAPFDADVMEALHDSGRTPLESLQMSSEAKELAHCMATLEGTHRQAVGLAFFHDLSHSEVAQQLALPIGTVKTWIRRSLERLHKCLARLGQA